MCKAPTCFINDTDCPNCLLSVSGLFTKKNSKRRSEESEERLEGVACDADLPNPAIFIATSIGHTVWMIIPLFGLKYSCRSIEESQEM